MDRFKMHVVNCAMLGAFVCAMPKQPGERIPAADLPLGANRKKRSASSCRTASAHRALALDGFDSLPFFPKQKQHPDGMLFWSRVRESMADLPLGANRKERSASSCRTASARRALALDGFDSLPFFPKQNSIPMGCCFVLEQGTGIEPASVAWEATILPMN